MSDLEAACNLKDPQMARDALGHGEIFHSRYLTGAFSVPPKDGEEEKKALEIIKLYIKYVGPDNVFVYTAWAAAANGYKEAALHIIQQMIRCGLDFRITAYDLESSVCHPLLNKPAEYVDVFSDYFTLTAVGPLMDAGFTDIAVKVAKRGGAVVYDFENSGNWFFTPGFATAVLRAVAEGPTICCADLSSKDADQTVLDMLRGKPLNGLKTVAAAFATGSHQRLGLDSPVYLLCQYTIRDIVAALASVCHTITLVRQHCN